MQKPSPPAYAGVCFLCAPIFAATTRRISQLQLDPGAEIAGLYVAILFILLFLQLIFAKAQNLGRWVKSGYTTGPGMGIILIAKWQGQRFPAAFSSWGALMSTAYWFMSGIVGGIVLFFVMERMGIIYKWFDKWDSWGEKADHQ